MVDRRQALEDVLGSARLQGAEPGPEMRAVLSAGLTGSLAPERLDEPAMRAARSACRWARRPRPAPPNRARRGGWSRTLRLSRTQVLRNHFGIRDPDELARRENDASTARRLELQANPLPALRAAALQALHRHIFGEIYPWAEEVRTVAIAKVDLFALPSTSRL